MDAVASGKEQTLIDECLAGRLEAFGELVAPYQDRLFNSLCRILGGRHEEAAESLQDALIRAFRGLESFQGNSSLYTWLYRIAVNVALSSRRRRFGSRQHADVSDLDIPDPDSESLPESSLIRQEQRQIVEQALDRLPDHHRTVLVMKDIDGLSYEEIAEVLDIPIGTVRSRLHRGRADLRQQLKPMLEKGLL
jgi:RNA polymerase sigma-70 factor (ECF subfamily)